MILKKRICVKMSCEDFNIYAVTLIILAKLRLFKCIHFLYHILQFGAVYEIMIGLIGIYFLCHFVNTFNFDEERFLILVLSN